jgi:hypothetical protein
MTINFATGTMQPSEAEEPTSNIRLPRRWKKSAAIPAVCHRSERRKSSNAPVELSDIFPIGDYDDYSFFEFKPGSDVAEA